jgi:molecular chaperone DnaK
MDHQVGAAPIRPTIDFGIDLGTTQSCIAVFDGTRTRLIKNNCDQDFTPSAVYIKPDGQLYVGWIALHRSIEESEDIATEFKMQMGTDFEFRFNRSGRIMRPEELSAEVLKSLKRDVSQHLGEDIRAAVITVPAAFNLAQCDATRRAANLAGLETAPLIEEPTAAAIAHAFQIPADKVFWLIYDLGGSTFKTAIIQIRDGSFRIIKDAGDNKLGSKMIDWEIVEKLLAHKAASMYHLPNFTPHNKKWYTAFVKLKYAAEQARIHLFFKYRHLILIGDLCKDDSGESLSFEYELTRQEFFILAKPFIQRSVNISRQALADAQLRPSDIEKTILVGEGTLAPFLREMLQDPIEGLLGIPLDFSIDPLTVVAQGAAIFAGTQRLHIGDRP